METVIKTSKSVILTEKMVDAVLDFSNGKTAKEIGRKQKKSARTIEAWMASMREAYKCKNTPHLVAHFLRMGIIK